MYADREKGGVCLRVCNFPLGLIKYIVLVLVIVIISDVWNLSLLSSSSECHIFRTLCKVCILIITVDGFSIYNNYMQYNFILLCSSGCIVNGFLGFFLGIVDIFVLTTVSVTRYLCVCHPMTCKLTLCFFQWSVSLQLYGVSYVTAPLVCWITVCLRELRVVLQFVSSNSVPCQSLSRPIACHVTVCLVQ